MGLLDSVLGAAVGSALGRGGLGGALGGGGRGGGGLLGSPVVKALIFALAAKAVHEHLNRDRTQAGKTAPSSGGLAISLAALSAAVAALAVGWAAYSPASAAPVAWARSLSSSIGADMATP